jgi:hypothetical protein
MVADAATAIEATGVIEVTVATAIAATAMATEVEVATAVAMVHTMALLTYLPHPLVPQMRTLQPLITTHSMPNGPLTILPTQPRILTLPMAVLQQSWLSIHRAATVSTMVTQLVRHSLPHLVLGLQHPRRRHPQNLQAMEPPHLLLRPLHRLAQAMERCLHHQACKCFEALGILPIRADRRIFPKVQEHMVYASSYEIGRGQFIYTLGHTMV